DVSEPMRDRGAPPRLTLCEPELAHQNPRKHPRLVESTPEGIFLLDVRLALFPRGTGCLPPLPPLGKLQSQIDPRITALGHLLRPANTFHRKKPSSRG